MMQQREDSQSDQPQPSFSRSWAHTNEILLCQEQADLIRHARTRLEEGASGDLGERESLVVPGARWHIATDANTNSVSLKLVPRPTWTANINDGYGIRFLLPLDGSKSWKFRTRKKTSSDAIFATR